MLHSVRHLKTSLKQLKMTLSFTSPKAYASSLSGPLQPPVLRSIIMTKSDTKKNLERIQQILLKNSSDGSVSMEYIIVSCFALLISVTAVTWLGKMVKARITTIAERLNLDTSELELDFDQAFDPAN
jgi:hypothetical protein